MRRRIYSGNPNGGYKVRFFDGLSFKEIADQTNTSINTTLGRVRYALINMRKIMEENQIILTR